MPLFPATPCFAGVGLLSYVPPGRPLLKPQRGDRMYDATGGRTIWARAMRALQQDSRDQTSSATVSSSLPRKTKAQVRNTLSLPFFSLLDKLPPPRSLQKQRTGRASLSEAPCKATRILKIKSATAARVAAKRISRDRHSPDIRLGGVDAGMGLRLLSHGSNRIPGIGHQQCFHAQDFPTVGVGGLPPRIRGVHHQDFS